MLFNCCRSLSALKKRLRRLIPASRRSNRRSRLSGSLEALESRTVPTVIIVTSAADGLLNDNQVTLREAIYAAENDVSVDGSATGHGADIIRFSENLANQIIHSSYSFLITTDLTIAGLGSSKLTIDGMKASNLFYVDQSAKAVISGLSLTNGIVGLSGQGGAINNLGSLTLYDCHVFENSAFGGGGGGIANSGNLTIFNSTISQNFCQSEGGGIKNDGILNMQNSTISANGTGYGDGGGIRSTGQMVISECVIVGNFGGRGGAIASSGLQGLTVRNTNVSGNHALGSGGGILISNSSATFENCTIAGNYNGESEVTLFGGGGIQVLNSTLVSHILTLQNCTISGNTATGNGGGIDLSNAEGNVSASIVSSTIANNVSGQDGGGLCCQTNVSSSILGVLLQNSIVADNQALRHDDDVSNTFAAKYSLIEKLTGRVLESVRGSNRYGVDPLLGPLADNGGPVFTHALLPGSPAINRGLSSGNLSYDQRGQGFVRAVGRQDIGAFEVQQKGVYLVTDPKNSTRQHLVVVGSSANDTIVAAVSGSGATQKINVTFNGRTQKFNSSRIATIVMQGNDGDDTLTLASSVTIGGILNGGAGDDTITGASGSDILLGGEGDDLLLGMGGNDVLIGGDGHDSLTGGAGDDLLIAGSTAYDSTTTLLEAIRTEWASATTFYTRIANLHHGLNGAPILDSSTIIDTFYDELTADTGTTGGSEFIFADENDLITGLAAANELLLMV
ncbi:MAG: hypothetical protein NT013_21310 [Planctomycetia bacterium]|nr:hypothetical protein [Planctomycetia bacterium]